MPNRSPAEVVLPWSGCVVRRRAHRLAPAQVTQPLRARHGRPATVSARNVTCASASTAHRGRTGEIVADAIAIVLAPRSPSCSPPSAGASIALRHLTLSRAAVDGIAARPARRVGHRRPPPRVRAVARRLVSPRRLIARDYLTRARCRLRPPNGRGCATRFASARGRSFRSRRRGMNACASPRITLREDRALICVSSCSVTMLVGDAFRYRPASEASDARRDRRRLVLG